MVRLPGRGTEWRARGGKGEGVGWREKGEKGGEGKTIIICTRPCIIVRQSSWYDNRITSRYNGINKM